VTDLPPIEIRGLTKRFGQALAVDSLTLAVPEGSVFGFLGPNGAGKTTTIRVLMGLANPTAGEVRLLGEVAGPACPAKRLVGFLPDVPAFYGWMTGPEYLRFAGDLFGLERSALKKRVGELLDLTGLTGVKTRIGGYSRGMKQRLGLAQALVNEPRLVILDEPTSALDPIGRHEVLETIQAMAQRTTVFFSTHILADVERVCDRVAILDQGRLLAEDTMVALKARYSRPIFKVRLAAGSEEFAQTASQAKWAEKVESLEGEVRILARDGETAKVEIPRLIGSRGLALEGFEISEPTLEDIFLKLVGEGKASHARS